MLTVAFGFMASTWTLRHPYPSPPERLLEVLNDRRYVEAKLQAVGGPMAKLVSWEQHEGGVTLVVHQGVPQDALPPFVRAMLPGGLTIERTETWTGADGSVHAVVDGAPGTITGVMRLGPDAAGSVLDAELTADVPVPLIGGKIEKIITSNVSTLLDNEYRFTLAWLDEPVSP